MASTRPAVFLAPALALTLGGALPPQATYDDAIRCAAVDMLMAGLLARDPAPARRAQAGRYNTLAALWLDDASKLPGKDKGTVTADLEMRANAIMSKVAGAGSAAAAEKVLGGSIIGCDGFEQAYAAPAAR